MTNRFSLPAALLALSLFLPSCLIGHRSDVETSGTYVSLTTFNQVKPGDSQELVLGLFGEPTTRLDAENGGRMIWKWSYTTEKRDRDTLLFVLSARTNTKAEGAVFVEFENGKVKSTWRD